MTKRLNEMLKFAEEQRKNDKTDLETYSSGTWDEQHKIYKQSELSGKIILWDWVIESLSSVLKGEEKNK